jgi:hypothetical protein
MPLAEGRIGRGHLERADAHLKPPIAVAGYGFTAVVRSMDLAVSLTFSRPRSRAS